MPVKSSSTLALSAGLSRAFSHDPCGTTASSTLLRRARRISASAALAFGSTPWKRRSKAFLASISLPSGVAAPAGNDSVPSAFVCVVARQEMLRV
jgi:hypothetical protein